MTMWRSLLGLLAVILIAVIIRAVMLDDMFAAFLRIGDEPWGVVTFTDLYVGFLVTSTLFWFAEARRIHAIGLIIALFILGNIVSALWLAVRLPQLARRLADAR